MSNNGVINMASPTEQELLKKLFPQKEGQTHTFKITVANDAAETLREERELVVETVEGFKQMLVDLAANIPRNDPLTAKIDDLSSKIDIFIDKAVTVADLQITTLTKLNRYLDGKR